MAIVYGNKMRARDIKDDEVLGARVRTRTGGSRMAELITISMILESVLFEIKTFPCLFFLGGAFAIRLLEKDHNWHVLTSTRCKGRVRCNATIQSGHFSNAPFVQSLHFIIPAAFPQFEHLV